MASIAMAQAPVGNHQSNQDGRDAATWTPTRQFVVTINVDGRDLQAITEWWTERPAIVKSWKDETTGLWLTSCIYDPFTRLSYRPSLPEN